MRWEVGEEDDDPARPPEGHGFKLQGQECWEFTGSEARFSPNCEWVGVAAPVPAVGDGQHPGGVRMTLAAGTPSLSHAHLSVSRMPAQCCTLGTLV